MASAKWGEASALDGRRGTPLVLSLSEGLGIAISTLLGQHFIVLRTSPLKLEFHRCTRALTADLLN